MLPHLVVECKYIIIKRQSDRADYQILVRGLASDTVQTIVVEHTFVAVLTAGQTTRVLSSSQLLGGKQHVQSLGALHQCPNGIHPCSVS